MAIFKLTHLATGRAMVVRAFCLSCARDLAANNCGQEGRTAWRDPGQSTVELIREAGKSGVVLQTTGSTG